MTSREKILAAIGANQPPETNLPLIPRYVAAFTDPAEKFKSTLESLGGKVHAVSGTDDMIAILKSEFPAVRRVVSALPGLLTYAAAVPVDHPHSLEDVDLAILPAHFAVAENGAVWVTDELLMERALPFIAKHLAAVVRRNDIVSTLHDAYDRIGMSQYSFGTFIAGPSKTADIEQSLVLGAHGAMSMTVFILT